MTWSIDDQINSLLWINFLYVKLMQYAIWLRYNPMIKLAYFQLVYNLIFFILLPKISEASSSIFISSLAFPTHPSSRHAGESPNEWLKSSSNMGSLTLALTLSIASGFPIC